MHLIQLNNFHRHWSKALVASYLAFILFTCFGCAGSGPFGSRPEGRDIAATVALTSGFEKLLFDVDSFVITGYAKSEPITSSTYSSTDLVIYLEGDGRAFINRSKPSSDPTPQTPLALQLATIDPAPNVLYLARPCQYTTPNTWRSCALEHWTVARYSTEILDAVDEAITQAKNRLHATRLHLVGYSGGGALAVLLADKRDDVASIITVAGNLDHKTWTTHHNVTPLWSSLNPADFAVKISKTPQVHISGLEDEIVPPKIARSYMQRSAKGSNATLVEITGATHCSWKSHWSNLLKNYRPLLIQ